MKIFRLNFLTESKYQKLKDELAELRLAKDGLSILRDELLKENTELRKLTQKPLNVGDTVRCFSFSGARKIEAVFLNEDSAFDKYSYTVSNEQRTFTHSDLTKLTPVKK